MSTNNRDNIYFAAKDGKSTATIVLEKANNWFMALDSNGYLDKLRDTWCAYNGAYYNDAASGHKITFSGEQGELVNLPVNHFRNIARNMLVMTTSTRPSMEARSVNTDYKSLVQTKLANGLLDYYMREKRLEDYLHRAIEMAIVLGSGYIKMEWNATTGEIVDVNEETNTPIHEGDLQFTNLSPFDVVFDSTKDDPSQIDWVLCRSKKNRYDLIAKYPEYKDQILKVLTVSEVEHFNFDSVFYDRSDDVFIYEFFHKRTESVPEGRYMMFVECDSVLVDQPLPYRNLPVYRVSPADILGTPFGYTDLFDLLPLQDAANILYSSIMSNQAAFAVQNVLVPRGADVSPTLLSGGLNVIEHNPGMEPKALNLTATPPEVFSFLDKIEKTMETISGINSVSRGNPESSLKSGNALALVQSMALQFISGLQQSYVKLIEDTGTGLLNILKDYASVPRIAMIVGKSNRTYMKEFTGDDLDSINRVIVDVGNPLAKTTAGRVEMAQQMLQMGVITTGDQYIQVITTGKLETLTDGVDRQLLLIKAENEKLVGGELPQAVTTERHSLHIKEHTDVLSDPDLKDDPELVQRVLAHIQQHIEILKTADPALLQMIGEQSLMPPPPVDENGNPLPVQQAPPPQDQGPIAPPQAVLDTAAPIDQNLPSIPDPAVPPAPFENLPTNAADMPIQG